MIYQIEIYYGALLNGNVIYSIKLNFTDCTKFKNNINEQKLENIIKSSIEKDGFNTEDFEIRFLTKEEYENRYDIEHEHSIKLNIKSKDNN